MKTRRSTMWIALAAVGVLAVAGVVVWQVWPTEEPAVAVPTNVCDDALPGTTVKALLPAKGKPFTEWHTGVLNPRGLYRKAESGTCKVYGGGKSITISHSRYSGSDFTMQDVAHDSKAAGTVRITLGKALGFHEGDTTSLFVDCSFRNVQEQALVEVDVTYEKTEDRAVIQKMASLAADTLRLEARKLWNCEGADSLPNGSPQVTR